MIFDNNISNLRIENIFNIQNIKEVNIYIYIYIYI